MVTKAAINLTEENFIEFFKNKQNVRSLASKRFQEVQEIYNQYDLESNENSQKVLAEVFEEIRQGDLRNSTNADFSNADFSKAENLLINELGLEEKDAVNFVFNLGIGLRYESGTW